MCTYVSVLSTCIVMSLLLCRVESERAQVLSMLNSSLKAKEQVQHQTASDSDLLKEIRSLREEVSGQMYVRMYVHTYLAHVPCTYGIWFIVVYECVRSCVFIHKPQYYYSSPCQTQVLSSRTLRDAVPVHNDSLNRSRRAEVCRHTHVHTYVYTYVYIM